MMRTGTAGAIATMIAIVTAASLAAVAGGAGMAKLLEPSLAKKKIPGNSHVEVTAKCTGATEVVSGGFAAPDRVYAGSGPYTDTIAATREGKSRFSVKAENLGSSGKIYAYAYCGDLGPITVESDETTVKALKNGSATASCPQGKIAISGGFGGKKIAGSGRARMIPYLSMRVGERSWKVSAENGSFNGESKLIAYAYCAELAEAPKAVVKDTPIKILSPASISSSCAPGTEAVAGGFDIATKRGFASGASVHSSRRKGDGRTWKVSLINGGKDRHGRAYAYCLPDAG